MPTPLASIETYENTSFSCVFTLRAAGVLIDLTDYVTATFHARAGTPDAPGAIVLPVSTATGHIVLGGAAGTVTVTLTPTDLARTTFPAKDYWAELTVSKEDNYTLYPCRVIWQHLPTKVNAA